MLQMFEYIIAFRFEKNTHFRKRTEKSRNWKNWSRWKRRATKVVKAFSSGCIAECSLILPLFC